ncbi:MAG: Hist deacetyl protein [Dehalococcoidia bacterium]|nr:Hist deacetyl protein [Dehalococcoidia bacterium]
MRTGLVYHPIYLEHDTGSHPENASRLRAVAQMLNETGLEKQLTAIEPRPATIEELSLVHTQELISDVQRAAQEGGGWLDPDTVVSPASYQVALYAAGGVLQALLAVMNGQVNNAFALVRPPGHHATPERAMGFCLFNNVAIAARYAQTKLAVERILIVDFDVHHGNGTQDTFYGDPRVLYFSTHQYPFYPGSGSIIETGEKEGKGYTVNVPLPAGCGDKEYRQVLNEVLIPVARRFQPHLILASAGYDAHWTDSIAMMTLTVGGYAQIATTLRKLADEHCQGRLLLALEGGYNTAALAASVRATFDVLLGNPESPDPMGSPDSQGTPRGFDDTILQVKRLHGLGPT